MFLISCVVARYLVFLCNKFLVAGVTYVNSTCFNYDLQIHGLQTWADKMNRHYAFNVLGRFMRRHSVSLAVAALVLGLFLSPSSAIASTPALQGARGNSIEFASASSYLTLSPGINVGASAFTFETYFKTGPVIDNGFFLGVGSGNGLSINIHSANEIQIDAFGINATVFVLPTSMQVNTWHHIAVSRATNNDETVWLDGVRATSGYNRWNTSITYGPVFTDTRNYNGNATGINKSPACGHCNQPGDRDFNGVSITGLRVVVGNSTYDPQSPTISLPSTPLTNLPNTALLLNVTNSSGFVTDSSGSQTIANNSVTFRPAEIALPEPPTALTAIAGNGEATISFTPSSDGGSPITNYNYSLDGSTYIPLSPASSTSPITIPGLVNGSTYTVYLKAVNAAGESVASSSVNVTPVAPVIAASGSTSDTSVSSPVVETKVKTKTVGSKKLITWNTDSELVLKTYNQTTKKNTFRKLTDGKAFVKNPQPGQTAKYTIRSSSGVLLKAFTIKARPGIPKELSVARQATTLNASWTKAAGAMRYRVVITPQVGEQIVLITTDSNISIDLKNSAKVTIKIIAIGANGLTSQVITKTA